MIATLQLADVLQLTLLEAEWGRHLAVSLCPSVAIPRQIILN